MPAFEITFHVYDPIKALYTDKNFRIEKLFALNRDAKKFTKSDYKTACLAIAGIMSEYNKGLRGGTQTYKYMNDNGEEILCEEDRIKKNIRQKLEGIDET